MPTHHIHMIIRTSISSLIFIRSTEQRGTNERTMNDGRIYLNCCSYRVFNEKKSPKGIGGWKIGRRLYAVIAILVLRFVIEGANAFDFVVVGRRGNIGDYTHHPASNVFIVSNNERVVHV